MKCKIAFLLAGAMMTAALAGCGSNTTEDTANTTQDTTPAVSEPADTTPEPTVTETDLATGTVTVYDYGTLKLHAYATGDALGDMAYIVEGADALVGIELPSFTDSLAAWQGYVESLNKPMEDLFLDAHAAGASYAEGMNFYGTQAAQEAIASGSTYATTQGLYETYGEDFHGGDDIAQINQVVSGTVTVGGIEFRLIDQGDTYDLEIPALNVIYTHMLGKTSHSILASTEAMDAMLDTLHQYQDAGYPMILSGHSTPEGQDAVTEKIAYVEKAKELGIPVRLYDNDGNRINPATMMIDDRISEEYRNAIRGLKFV